MRIALTSLVSLILLSGCTERPETKDYFYEATSIALCPGSSVRNVNEHSIDRSSGFDSIYIVDVQMPKACEGQFYRDVSKQLMEPCEGAGCSGPTVAGGYLGVEPIAGNRIRVTSST
jgi:hypothetical protein